MRGFEHADAFARNGITVARHHHAFERPIPELLEGGGELGRALARTDDDGSPARPHRHMGPQRGFRIRRLDGGVKQAGQEFFVFSVHNVRHLDFIHAPKRGGRFSR